MAEKQSDADMLRREPVAKNEDIPQFLKGTPNAVEAGFLSPDFHSHAKKIPK
jgi:hypothetical protein